MRDPWHRSIKDVIVRSIEEAAGRGSATVEAEHLLLAVAADPSLPSANVLAEFGWNYAGIVAALDDERAASLAVAGVKRVAPDVLASSPRQARPRWGASARGAIENAGLGIGRTSHRTGSGDAELILSVVEIEFGTVPRALAYARIDRDILATRLTRKAAA